MKIMLANDSYSLNIKPGDRVYETIDVLYFDISTDVPYYGYYPNEWYKSYKAQLYEFFKKEKGNWFIWSKEGYYCFSPSEIDTDLEVKRFFEAFEVRLRAYSIMKREENDGLYETDYE